MRRAWLHPLATFLALILVGGGSTLIIFSLTHTTGSRRSPQGLGPSTRRQPRVTFTDADFASWALLDLATGAITGSVNSADQGDTMSMIKTWIAADYLRERESISDQDVLERLSIMIRDSDNAIATEFHHLNGERLSIARMVQICGLTDSHAGTVNYRWSDTVMSARDMARLGLCLSNGRAAAKWTRWLLQQMRGVRGEGDFGPRKALPADAAAKIAIKNGWFERPEDGHWHFACLAISDRWSLAVLIRYPSELGEAHGRNLCQSAGTQLLPMLS